jgi:hypothetical protein
VLRNRSTMGACLEVESPIGIPNSFTLIILSEKAKVACEVVWRAARQIGVRFVA